MEQPTLGTESRRRWEQLRDDSGDRKAVGPTIALTRPGRGSGDKGPPTTRAMEQAVDDLRPRAVDCLRLWQALRRPPPGAPPGNPRHAHPADPQWGARHGHGIGQAIRTQSDDLLKVETGSLYPALHRLVKRGWLKTDWGVSEANQRASTYRLTPAGKAQLLREQDRWSQLVHAIGGS